MIGYGYNDHIYVLFSNYPDTRYSGVEVTQRTTAYLNLIHKAIYNIDGLELAYAGNTGIGNYGNPEQMFQD